MAINMDAVLELSAKVDGMSQLLQLERSLADVKGELNKYEGAQKTATTQSSLFNAATVALGGFMLDAAYKAAEFVKQSVALGFSFEQTQTRLRMLSEGYGEYDAVQAIITKNADMLGQSQVQAANGFADIYARLRPLGVSLEDVNAVYLGFNSLAMQSGTTAEAASGAFMQLSQALGSGTLRGDEFNSVAEQVPGILIEVAQVMGKPVGALRGLAAEGKITSDVVIQAMRNAAASGGESLGELTQGAANAGNRLNVAFQDFLAMIGRELVPALAPLMDGLTAIVELAGQYLVPVVRLVAEGWQWVYSVIMDQLVPAVEPLIAAFQRAFGKMDVTYIAKVWQGIMVVAIKHVIEAVDFLSPIVAGVVDLFRWLLDNPVFNFIADQVKKVADGFVKARDEAMGVNTAAEATSATMTSIAGKTAQIKGDTELTKEELKAQEEARKKLLEQIKEEQKYSAAITDKEKAKLDILLEQAEQQRKKYDGTELEFAALVKIRDIKLKEAEIDYKAAQDKIRAQVELGQMTDREAQVRLEILKIQYDSTNATINQTHQQEVLNERAERQKKLQADLTVQTIATEVAQSEVTAEVERTSNALDRATSAAGNLEERVKSVAVGIREVNGVLQLTYNGFMAASEIAKLQAEFADQVAERAEKKRMAALQEELNKLSEKESYVRRINDLYAKGTKEAEMQAKIVEEMAGSMIAQEAASQRMQQALVDQNARSDKLIADLLAGIPRMAVGGYVTSPTAALIGEGGEPEYVIPASKMASASTAFLSGSRGASVLQPATSTSSGPMAVNIQTGPVMSMGGQQYVSKTDLSMAVTQAVQQTMALLTGNSNVRQLVGI